jgi:prefoldin subunit 5
MKRSIENLTKTTSRLDVRVEEMHGDLQNHDQRAREIAQQIEAIRNAHRLDS